MLVVPSTFLTFTSRAAHRAWLEEHASIICKELNVKRVEFTERAEQYITYSVLPDLKRLGPRLGKRLPALKKLLADEQTADFAGIKIRVDTMPASAASSAASSTSRSPPTRPG